MTSSPTTSGWPVRCPAGSAIRGEPQDELYQVALVALCAAARRFDPEQEVSFATFATVSVLGELKRHFRDRSRSIRAPRRLHDLLLRVGEAREVLAQGLGGPPTVADISAYLEVTDEQVLEAMEAAEVCYSTSLDAGHSGWIDLDRAAARWPVDLNPGGGHGALTWRRAVLCPLDDLDGDVTKLAVLPLATAGQEIDRSVRDVPALGGDDADGAGDGGAGVRGASQVVVGFVSGGEASVDGEYHGRLLGDLADEWFVVRLAPLQPTREHAEGADGRSRLAKGGTWWLDAEASGAGGEGGPARVSAGTAATVAARPSLADSVASSG